MEANIIIGLQSIHNVILTFILTFSSKLGEELFFIMLFGVVYLCFSMKKAIKLGLIFTSSAVLNSVVKSIFSRPRPYVTHSNIVDMYGSSGSSFPSGHSQSYATMMTETGMLIKKNKPDHKKRVLIPFVILALLGAVLVGLSRMYLGQHYLTDVLAGLTLGFVFVLVVEAIIPHLPDKFKKITLNTVMIVGTVVGLVVIIILCSIGKHNSSAFKYVAMFFGLGAGYTLNLAVLDFDPKESKVIEQFVKVIVMIVSVVGLNYLIIGTCGETKFELGLVYMLSSFVVTFVIPSLVCLVHHFAKKRRKKENDIL